MQTWTENCYDASHVVNTDMSNIEINFATLKSAFSGIAAPAAIVAGQIYFNTSKNIHHFLNAAESDLLGLLPGDLSTKIWQYRNDATPGWVVDASIADKVIALKGGTGDYNISGGSTGGNWTQPNHTHTGPSHTHTGADHKHLTAVGHRGTNNIVSIKQTPPGGSEDQTVPAYESGAGAGVTTNTSYSYTNNTTPGVGGASGTGATGGSATVNTYHPAAAVGTLQYPNVTQS